MKYRYVNLGVIEQGVNNELFTDVGASLVRALVIYSSNSSFENLQIMFVPPFGFQQFNSQITTLECTI